MKTKSLIALSVLIGSCMVVQAQDKPKREGRPGPPPELLKKFDKDGDGKLSEEERKAMREAHQASMEERRKEMLEKYDKDGDGQLSEEERKTMREARQAEMEKRRKELLEKYDKDGDGKLSPEERAAIPPEERPRLRGPRGPGGPEGRPNRRGRGPGGPPPVETE